MTGDRALNVCILVDELHDPLKTGQAALTGLDRDLHGFTHIPGLLCLLLDVLHDYLGGFNHSKDEGPEGEGTQVVAEDSVVTSADCAVDHFVRFVVWITW